MIRAALLLACLASTGCGIVHEMITDNVNEELNYRVRRGDVTDIAQLAGQGVDLDEPWGVNNWTPLQHAIHKQQTESVRVLLEWGAQPDFTVSGNERPVVMARKHAGPEIVKLLIDAGADVSDEDAGRRPKDARAGTPAIPGPFRP